MSCIPSHDVVCTAPLAHPLAQTHPYLGVLAVLAFIALVVGGLGIAAYRAGA
jgi:hypothetical protein